VAARQALEARFGLIHNAGMAAVSLLMIGTAIVHFASGDSANAPTLSLNDPRFVLFSVLAVAMAYYVYIGISRYLDRTPQIVIDHDGIAGAVVGQPQIVVVEGGDGLDLQHDVMAGW